MDTKDGTCMDHQSKTPNARTIFNKNERERKTCDQRTKVIALERRVACARLSREERSLRSQLERLQTERKAAAKDENSDHLARYMPETLDLDGETDDSDIHIFLEQQEEEEVVLNPYPVTIGRTRKISMPASSGRISPTRYRRDSLDYDELHQPLHSPSSTSKLLPPILSQSRHLVGIRSEPQIFGKSSSGSCCLSPPDTKDGNLAPEIWVGDPEAISSVRRHRKSPAQQRLERSEKNAHRWARSRSLKEGVNVQKKDVVKVTSLSRSHSLKEPTNNNNSSLLLRRSIISSCCSTATSLSRASSIVSKASSECSLDSDSGGRHFGKTSRGRNCADDDGVKGNILKVNICPRSPEAAADSTTTTTTSAVWGWIESLDPEAGATARGFEEFAKTDNTAVLKRSQSKKEKKGTEVEGGVPAALRRSSSDKRRSGKLPTSSSLNIVVQRQEKGESATGSSMRMGERDNTGGGDNCLQISQHPHHLSVARCFEILAASAQEK